MTAPFGEGRAAQFICGAIMILLAAVVFHRARVAEENRQAVPSYRYDTWMSPRQAYVASVLCLGGGLLIIVFGAAASRRERPRGDDTNI